MRLLDLADAAPQDGAARRLAFEVLEQPLSEILESRTGLIELLGPNLDLGGQLAAMTRLVARDAVAALAAIEPQVGQGAAAAAGRGRRGSPNGWRSRRSPARAPPSAAASCAS